MSFEQQYEDRERKEHQQNVREKRSRYCDFVFYKSSQDPSITLAMRILKPEKPSYILATTHGWHMSISDFKEFDCAQSEYLRVEVDMRGRAFSEGKQDCSGYELLDVIDAVEYVKKNYAEYIIDPETVYFAAGSGGGGNAFTIACKFPDYFAHVSSDCGMSDYEKWYLEDKKGEFQDELCVWIGDISNKEAYRSRSGAHLVKNLCAPLCITHGVNDIRVPISHSRLFIEKAKQCGKGDLVKILELEGVGGWDHFDKITPEQRKERIEFIENDRKERGHIISIPEKGSFLVGGYLVTRHFSVFLNDQNRVAEIEYDLKTKTAEVKGFNKDEYTLVWRD